MAQTGARPKSVYYFPKVDRQITKTIYDAPVSDFQNFLTSRKRVTASVYLENKWDAEGDSTLYNYDILGNVKTLQQHIKALVAVDATNGKKQIDYDYDLVSGKVNKVSYQLGKGDQFMYSYLYDADNRVIESRSSRDGLVWRTDASYRYYLHGPLARTELGHLKSQGVDYAYTLQGWLKGINSDSLNPTYDMAKDGHFSSEYGFARVARDVYGFKLGYFDGEYTAIHNDADAFTYKSYTAPTLLGSGNNLYNGNISNTTIALSKINAGATTGYTYGYDQLNRLVKMRQHFPLGSAWDSTASIITAYGEDIAYDANGNILKYLRRGSNGQLDMDSLTYHYTYDENGMLLHNKLNHVADQVSAGNYTIDIDEQAEDNYEYDYIGNLKKDVKEGIDDIDWTVYGKIKKIDKGSGYGTGEIVYGYDAAGNRTSKKLTSSATDTLTYYVRDAQGNVLAIYSKDGSNSLKWNEQHLYGNSRLGVWHWEEDIMENAPNVTGTFLEDSLHVGNRNYELSNHLGNVLATISDKIIGNDSSGTTNFYLAESLTQQDYYPGGMLQPDRKFDLSSLKYRYGFNGKENDNEVKGEGNQQDYGMRIYDPRLGRFLSVDPIAQSFPWLTPYQFAGNMPIVAIDLDGEEQKIVINWFDNQGYLTKSKIVKTDFETVNLLYKNLSKGLNNEVTYNLEGTKFNSLNAHFASGFESYKEGTKNPRSVQNRIRPNNGALIFSIKSYSNGESFVDIDYLNIPIDEKELALDATRGLAKVGGNVGAGIEGLGYATSYTPIGLPLIGIGKGTSLTSDLLEVGVDMIEKKMDDAHTKLTYAVVGSVTGSLISEIPYAKRLTKEAIDSYIGRGLGTIKNGYFENRAVEIEESDKLNLTVEKNK